LVGSVGLPIENELVALLTGVDPKVFVAPEAVTELTPKAKTPGAAEPAVSFLTMSVAAAELPKLNKPAVSFLSSELPPKPNVEVGADVVAGFPNEKLAPELAVVVVVVVVGADTFAAALPKTNVELGAAAAAAAAVEDSGAFPNAKVLEVDVEE
jgi:hypothetical protein